MTSGSNNWTNTQVFAFAVISLLIGIGSGSLIRRSQSRPNLELSAVAPAPAAVNTPSLAPSSEQLKGNADVQTAAKLEQLKVDPNNVGLLIELGNLYYDSKQYPSAIEYYKRVLKLHPSNTSVRTDLGTAYWYTGDAETAIEQFNKALAYEPNKPNALFNLGLVKWQGKKDIKGAVATWQKLLDANPNYEAKDKVLQIIVQAKQSAAKNP